MPFKINLWRSFEFQFKNGFELKCLEVSCCDNLRIVFQNQLVISLLFVFLRSPVGDYKHRSQTFAFIISTDTTGFIYKLKNKYLKLICE